MGSDRKLSFVIGSFLCLVLTLGLSLFAQQRANPAAQVPAPYRAPRTGDNRPNLNDIWQALNEANWNIEPHAAGFGTVPALGAINGMILTGTRIYAVWGADYPAFAWLAAWNRRTAAPIAAMS